jgi:hypothetical protein
MVEPKRFGICLRPAIVAAYQDEKTGKTQAEQPKTQL